MVNVRQQGPLCATTAEPIDSGTMELVCSPAPGPIGYRHEVHHKLPHHHRNLHHHVHKHKHKVVEGTRTLAKKIRTARVSQTKGRDPQSPMRMPPTDLRNTMAGAIEKPGYMLEKIQPHEEHGVDLESLYTLWKTEYLPMAHLVTDYLKELEEARLGILEELLKVREGCLAQIESLVAQTLPKIVHATPEARAGLRLELAVLARMADRLKSIISELEDLISFVERFAKFLEWPVIIAELLKNLVELYHAATEYVEAKNPDAPQTNAVALHLTGTIVAALCVVCMLVLGAEAAIIVAVMSIAWGLEEFILEPLTNEKEKEKFKPLSQKVAEQGLGVLKQMQSH